MSAELLQKLSEMAPHTGRYIAETGDTFNIATMWNDVYDSVNSVLKTSATISGDVNVDSTSLSLDGYVGKASGTNADFTVAYTSAITLTLSNLPAGVSAFTADDIVTVVQVATDGSVTATYTRDDSIMTLVANVLTVSSATFAATDTFIVYTNVAKANSYDSSSTANKIFNTSPLNSVYGLENLVDTTNVTATTHTYQFTMDNYQDFAVSGKLIDADGTLTLTFEATNDEDTSGGDWIQVYGYDDKNNLTTNSWTVTNGTLTFAISFNNMNYKHVRASVVASGETNTVIIKGRKKAL